ncbi:hypothetical protein chiPu_0021591, partial [Chiloscyllium punctatum]|nr:hypothetical protein [Chiloscyllium punctatum]
SGFLEAALPGLVFSLSLSRLTEFPGFSWTGYSALIHFTGLTIRPRISFRPRTVLLLLWSAAEVMAKDAARVARIVNETVEEGKNSLDLSNCKLTTFPVALFKVMKNVVANIHVISLENNELKLISGEFMTNFNQVREIPVDSLASMPFLKLLNMKSNPLSSDSQRTQQSVLTFELLTRDE